MTVPEPQAPVPLKRDPHWWLHPALRGREALVLGGVDALPCRWVRSDAAPVRSDTPLESDSRYADFAKLLYNMNGCRPGPVQGWYVIVGVEPGKFAVGQLCADPVAPVTLFEDLVYASEAEARSQAERMKAMDPGLRRI